MPTDLSLFFVPQLVCQAEGASSKQRCTQGQTTPPVPSNSAGSYNSPSVQPPAMSASHTAASAAAAIAASLGMCVPADCAIMRADAGLGLIDTCAPVRVGTGPPSCSTGLAH